MKIKFFICFATFCVALIFFLSVIKEAPDNKPQRQFKKNEPEKKVVQRKLQQEPGKNKKKKNQTMVINHNLPPNLAAALAENLIKKKAFKEKKPAAFKISVKVKKNTRVDPAVSNLPKRTKKNNKPQKPKKMRQQPVTCKTTYARNKPKPVLQKKIIKINAEHCAAGRRLQKKGIELPIIEASWDNIGFDSYLKKMQRAGGRLFVGDVLGETILAQVELHYFKGRFRFLRFHDAGSSSGMAFARPREIIDEPLVKETLASAHLNWPGKQDLALVMILPPTIETGFLGTLTHYLASSNYTVAQFRQVFGKYFISSQGLGLKIISAVKRDNGQRINLNLSIMI